MSNKYTQENIDDFLGKFKQLPEYYGIEKVHRLINNPEAKARLSGKPFIKPLNFIFMTAFFISGITIVTIGLSTMKDVNDQKALSVKTVESTKTSSIIVNFNQEQVSNAEDLNSLSDSKKKKEEKSTEKQQAIVTEVVIADDTNSLFSINSSVQENCNWPEDTLLDKRKLFVYLNESERERVGLFYKVDSTKIPMIESYAKLYKDGISVVRGSKRGPLYYISGFNVEYTSDTACTSYRWNSPFYNSIDTLVPVVHANQIFWFSPVQGVFDSLPARYGNLKETYANLKCLKKKFPDRQLVKYWNKKKILGDIKLINLTKEELEKIGVNFNKEENSYGIVNPLTKKAFYTVYGNGIVVQSKDTSSKPYIPVFKTDEKGLSQKFFNASWKKKNIQSIVDILVPVKIPLNEYISGIDYYDVYWYNPTDSFIELLPERIRYTLKAEIESVLKNSKVTTSSGCTYFEACQSTLQLDNLNIFPNPAIQSVTVQFTANQDMTGYISLSNMAGVPVKQLTTNAPIKAGYNTFQVDLSGIRSGMYLLTIVSDKGFVTKRLIIL